MNPCKECELSFRHGGKDGAWMCRGVSPAEPADNFNHEACEAFRKQWKQQKTFTDLYKADITSLTIQITIIGREKSASLSSGLCAGEKKALMATAREM